MNDFTQFLIDEYGSLDEASLQSHDSQLLLRKAFLAGFRSASELVFSNRHLFIGNNPSPDKIDNLKNK